MEKPSMGFVKIGSVLMVAALVMLAGAIIGFSANAPHLGIVFAVLMVAFAAAAFSVAVVFRSRAKKWRDEQRLAARAAGMQAPPDYGQSR